MTDKELRGNVSCNPHLFDDIVLDRVEHYDASQVDCYAFRRGTDVKGGHSLALGNMVNGFPFEFHGVTFANSELAYICGCFSENTELHRDLQGQLVKCSNGLLAKRAIRRPHTADTRADWEGYNIQWMLYVVWQKVIGNKDFQEVLLDIPQEAVIIEDSTFQAGRTAENWGTRNKALKDSIKRYKAELRAQGLGETAIKRELDARRLGEWSRQGVFEGKNLMGKILMMCARALREGVEPPIDYKALNDAHIYFLGNLLTFKDMKKNNPTNPFADLVLGREEEYAPKTEYVFPFKVIGDPVDGIDCRYSNMAGGFPFEFERHLFKNSEELMPIAVESGQMGEWTEVYNERDALIERLNDAADAYIEERARADPSVWSYAHQKNQECAEAMTELYRVYQEEQMSTDEWQRKLAPIKGELENTRRFAIAKIVEQSIKSVRLC